MMAGISKQNGGGKMKTRGLDRKSTRLNSSHSQISYAVFCLKKKKNKTCTLIYTTKEESIENILGPHLQRKLNRLSVPQLIVIGCISRPFACELRLVTLLI